MEGATAGFAFASGMAVYSTMAALLQSGDHIVSSSSVLGNHSLFVNYFPKWNIETTYFDINNPDIIESCIKPNTKILLPNHLLTQRLIL
jgi:O-succinylhomoserine sulfhydrylase